MTPAEITRMLKEESNKKFGHEQMMKHEYTRMLWLMRHRALEQDIYERTGGKRHNPFMSGATENILSKHAVIGDTNALANYKKWYPKTYAIELKRLAKKGN